MMSTKDHSAFAHSIPSQIIPENTLKNSFYRGNNSFLDQEQNPRSAGVFIPQNIWELFPQVCSTKTEILVFLCVVKYTVGFNRPQCTLSKSFIAKWAGLDPANVKRGISGLVNKKIILKKFSPKNRTTVFELAFHIGVNATPEVKLPLVKMTAIPTELGANCPQHASQNDLDSGVSSTHKIKEIKKINFIKSLGSKRLQEYFQGLLHDPKFFPEMNNFQILKNTRNESEIERALDYVLTNGTVGSANSCAVPMAYLVKAIERVLELDNLGKASKIKSECEKNQSLLQKRNEEILSRRREKAESSFQKAYPSKVDQEKFINKFIQSKYQGKIVPSSRSLKRMLAINEWFQAQSTSL